MFDTGLALNNDAVKRPGEEGAPVSERRFRENGPFRLSGVIAIVGCDGSGKSTLTADLCAHLRDEYAPRLLYLGQDSGNILRAILGVPLIGPAIGRYLVKRSRRAHAQDGKSASPDSITALAIYLLSLWRRHKFRRMVKLARAGTIIVTDRYPQAEAPGFYFDGPGLAVTDETNGFICWLAARERRLYRDMAAYVPALLIRLNIDAQTAHARKPDHKLAMLQDKVGVIPTLTFNGAPLLDLDASTPYAGVLREALAAARATLESAGRRSMPASSGDPSHLSADDDAKLLPRET
jgi:hypothetical protein